MIPAERRTNMILITLAILVASDKIGAWPIDGFGDTVMLLGLITITLLGDVARVKSLFK